MCNLSQNVQPPSQRSVKVAFLGLFGRRKLEKMKAAKVRADLQKVERREARLSKEAARIRDRMEGKRRYAQNEPRLTDDDLVGLALDVEELEYDLAVKNNELRRVRDQKRAMKGVLIVLQQKEGEADFAVWDDITKMSPENLEEGLQKLGDIDAGMSGNVDTIRDVLGVTPGDERQNLSPGAIAKFDEFKAYRDNR